MGELRRFLPRQTVGVCAGYRGGRIVAAVALVTLGDDDGLRLSFPKRNPFAAGEAVTVHLDDRVGSELYTIELRVYRASYKGTVASTQGSLAVVVPVHFELYYGGTVVASGGDKGYAHPADARPAGELPLSPLVRPILSDERENANKLGVLISRAGGRPHTTVMAFLNSTVDDIFLITMRETFKYQNLIRDPDCVFALDHRGTSNFERQVDWNYTIYEAKAHRIAPSQPAFRQIQDEFVRKNPWEAAFFTRTTVEMIHLVPRRIIQQDILCD